MKKRELVFRAQSATKDYIRAERERERERECWKIVSTVKIYMFYQHSVLLTRHDAAFKKLICISRSTSHTSKLEVMCLVTFLGVQLQLVQATSEK